MAGYTDSILIVESPRMQASKEVALHGYIFFWVMTRLLDPKSSECNVVHDLIFVFVYLGHGLHFFFLDTIFFVRGHFL